MCASAAAAMSVVASMWKTLRMCGERTTTGRREDSGGRDERQEVEQEVRREIRGPRSPTMPAAWLPNWPQTTTPVRLGLMEPDGRGVSAKIRRKERGRKPGFAPPLLLESDPSTHNTLTLRQSVIAHLLVRHESHDHRNDLPSWRHAQLCVHSVASHRLPDPKSKLFGRVTVAAPFSPSSLFRRDTNGEIQSVVSRLSIEGHAVERCSTPCTPWLSSISVSPPQRGVRSCTDSSNHSAELRQLVVVQLDRLLPVRDSSRQGHD